MPQISAVYSQKYIENYDGKIEPYSTTIVCNNKNNNNLKKIATSLVVSEKLDKNDIYLVK